MQILLLATGETEKLRPLTENIPSPMLPVANRPIMVYAIEMLARQGIKKVIVALYHLGGSVEAYFGDGRRWGVEIEYLLQRDAWGTAGALKWAEHSLTDTFMVLPADILIDLDVEAVLAQHRAKNSVATIVLQENGFGEPVCLGENGRLFQHSSTTATPSLFPTGVAIFEPEILALIPVRKPFDFAQQLLPALLTDDYLMHGYRSDGYYNALDSFSAYQAAQYATLSHSGNNGHILDGTTRALEAKQIATGIWVGRNHVIHPSVRLAPPIYIGDNCQLGRDVEIGPNVILGRNVVIDDGATVFESIILDYTYVGQLANVNNRIINKNLMIDVATTERVEIVDTFLLGEAHPALIDSWLRRIWDIIMSLSLLLFTLPITLPLGLITWLITGRVIEQQTYLGRQLGSTVNNPEFDTFTMHHFHTRRTDGNLTGFGRWLRKSELYRLPELWNVLKGDMSLIGVKPLQLAETVKIVEAWQRQRYQYPAGFTGLWYIQTDSDSALDEVLIADAYYVATRTRRGDIKISWQTPSCWLRRLRN